MKQERPILFSTDMVHALLAGKKTVTRRIVKGLPENANDELVQIMVSGHHRDHGHTLCPFGKVGDKLWVRENWIKIPITCKQSGRDFAVSFPDRVSQEVIKRCKMKPSIHLKKEDARIWLEVTGVRVERLQNITEEDAKSEGVLERDPVGKGNLFVDYNWPTLGGFLTAVDSFKSLWRKIHGREGWNANPWVWVISFKVLSTTGRPE